MSSTRWLRLSLAVLAVAATTLAPSSHAAGVRPCSQSELDARIRGDVPPPVGFGTCTGISPGQNFQILDEDGNLRTCAFDFAYRGSDKRTYLSAQGSCYLNPTCLELLGIMLPVCIIVAYSDREPVFPPGQGIPVRDMAGTRVGELSYAIYDGTFDFALIRLDPRVPFSPQVCHVGGPTGIETGVRTTPEPLLISSAEFHLTGVAARGLYHPLHVNNVVGASTGGGFPVLTESGLAVGTNISIGLGTNAGDIVERLSWPLARSAYRTKLRLSLLTAPLL